MLRVVQSYALCVCILAANAQFEVPDATIEILHPKGFTISIPDEPGIRLFAIHAKINEEMNGRESGDYSRDIAVPKNGRWTFLDKNTRFKVGDVIYYWTNVDYFDGERKLAYFKDDQQFVVQDVPKNNGNKGNKGNNKGGNKHTWENPIYTSTRGTSTTTTTTATTPKITTTPRPTCIESSTKVNNGIDTCSGRLVFSETFDKFDNGTWRHEIKFGGDPDYEFVTYSNDKQNVFVEDGILHIRPTLAEDKYGVGFVELPGGFDLGPACTGVPDSLDCKQIPKAFVILPPVFSARINTKKSFSFVYGRIDIDAKLPKGDWIYPELFLTPKNNEYGDWYDSGEIRIAFLAGNEHMNRALKGGCILGPSPAARTHAMKTFEKGGEARWCDDFHTFSVEWQPDLITLLVDNMTYGQVIPPVGGFASSLEQDDLPAASKWRQSGPMAPFDKEMFITIGVGVGGQSFPDSNDKWTLFNSTDPKAQRKFHKARETWRKTWGTDSQLLVNSINVYAL